MADFLDKLDKSIGSLGRALGDVTPSGPVDFAQMLASPQSTTARNWGDILGQQRTGLGWSSMLGQQSGQGPSWMQGLQQSAQGGTNWSSLLAGGGSNKLFDLSGFDLFNSERNQRLAREAQQAEQESRDVITEKGGGATGGTGGSYDSDIDKFEMYRAYIQKYATAEGIDPDALAAMLWIETDGGTAGATAVSGAGARGLGQVMPGTWAGLADPGEDPFNAEHSIKAAAKYFAQQYRTFGNYGLAAAAYQGGPGAIVNGQARSDISDGNLTPAQYAARWQQNYERIRSSAPQRGGSVPVNAQGAAFPIVGYQGNVQLHWGEDSGAADLFAPAGTPVAAMRGGRVTSAGYSDIGGYNVTIQGDDGLTYYYAHLQNPPSVQAGQAIKGGTVFGQVGDTGNAKGTGAHLHLGVGYGIQSGTGPRGGSGINFNLTQYLQQLLGVQAGGGGGSHEH